MRIVNWFWRNQNAPDLGTCPGCGAALLECPACRGDWRTHGCRSCQIGAVCPAHVNKWI